MAKKTKRPGQPAKKASEKRTSVVAIMFTPSEHKKLSGLAGEVPLSTWLRERVLARILSEPAVLADVQSFNDGVMEHLAESKRINAQALAAVEKTERLHADMKRMLREAKGKKRNT